MDNFHDFIETVRDANLIEDVIQDDGFPLRGHQTMRGARNDCDSLNVRTDWQRAWWYSRNWQGDVFGWVQLQKSCEFMEALEMLARRAGIEMPKFQKVNETELRRTRATADIFSVAASVFQRWLIGKEVEPDAKATEYVHSRGWTDETIEDSLTGFSGRRTGKQVKDMAGEFDLFGLDKLSPAAVAVMGFRGDVAKWAKDQGLLDGPDFDKGWIEKGRIHGLMDTPGLVYAHQKPIGKVIYLSRRQLPGHDMIQERAWKSFNPHKALAGPKQFFYNQVYRLGEPCVLVEGQGDAITWGQWGISSVAFCGLMGNFEHKQMEEQERLLREINKLKRHPQLYLCLDDDEAGQRAIKAAGKLFGPTMQVVRWSKLRGREDPPAADAASPHLDPAEKRGTSEHEMGGEVIIEESVDA